MSLNNRTSGNSALDGLSSCDRVQQKSLFIDLYRRPFSFILPDHMPMYRTFLGSALSLFTIIVLVGYASYKMLRLSSMRDYQISVVTNEYFYDSSFTFSQIDGFAVAAAVTSYDGGGEPIEDPSIGTVKFYLKQWGLDGNPGITFAEVTTRPCKITDFNLKDVDDEADSIFYPVNPVS